MDGHLVHCVLVERLVQLHEQDLLAVVVAVELAVFAGFVFFALLALGLYVVFVEQVVLLEDVLQVQIKHRVAAFVDAGDGEEFPYIQKHTDPVEYVVVVEGHIDGLVDLLGLDGRVLALLSLHSLNPVAKNV